MECEMDIKYENYLKSDDRIKIINGKEYHKVVDCHIFDSFGIMSVSFEAAPKPNIWLIDENGFKFFSKGLVMMSFRGPIPEWYFKLANIGIDVSKPCKIGNYVRMYDEESEKND